MITTAAAARNIQFIVDTIITPHTSAAFLVECNTQGTPSHHDFSLLISVECACVEWYP